MFLTVTKKIKIYNLIASVLYLFIDNGFKIYFIAREKNNIHYKT